MPIYAYRCAKCGHEVDALQKLSEPALVQCPACGAQALTKLLTAPGFQLKGSGWYATDFKQAAKTPAASDAKPDAKAESKSDAKSETPASESKGESKAEAKSEPKVESKSESKGDAKSDKPSAPAASSD